MKYKSQETRKGMLETCIYTPFRTNHNHETLLNNEFLQVWNLRGNAADKSLENRLELIKSTAAAIFVVLDSYNIDGKTSEMIRKFFVEKDTNSCMKNVWIITH